MKKWLFRIIWSIPPTRWLLKRQMRIVKETDPERIEPELTGRLFGFGERLGRRLCEMAVSDGDFGRNEDGTYYLRDDA